ncbi:MAG: DUF4097 family beta strand repeat protein [Bacteroidales bacterium]|nr:DUF4097 family beta strand repeat protein [Bacteroidales bacterium]
MKTIRIFTMAVCVLLYNVNLLYAGGDEVKKTINKEYAYNDNTHLIIKNKFGKVDVKDWDQNLVTIEVIITVDHPNREKAEQILKCINVEFEERGNIIQATTKFDDKVDNIFHKNEERNMTIDYNVYVPRNIQLDVSNKYGDIYLSQLSGLLSIDIAYGNLKADKLLREDNDPMSNIGVAYGSANIGESKWLKLNIKYSKLQMDETEAVVLLTRYSGIKMGKASSVVTDSKYDSYELGDISNIACDASYSNFKISSVKKKMILESQYSDIKIGYMPKDFKVVNIDSRYGKVNIGIDNAASYKISGEAHYGKISYPENGKVSCVDQSNTFTVLGYVGNNQDAEAVVKINTSYCSVKLTE